jgi:hypothetical protein
LPREAKLRTSASSVSLPWMATICESFPCTYESKRVNPFYDVFTFVPTCVLRQLH